METTIMGYIGVIWGLNLGVIETLCSLPSGTTEKDKAHLVPASAIRAASHSLIAPP